MDSPEMAGGLIILRLGGILVVLLAVAYFFFRKRKNRHPMEYANPQEEARAQADRHSKVDGA